MMMMIAPASKRWATTATRVLPNNNRSSPISKGCHAITKVSIKSRRKTCSHHSPNFYGAIGLWPWPWLSPPSCGLSTRWTSLRHQSCLSRAAASASCQVSANLCSLSIDCASQLSPRLTWFSGESRNRAIAWLVVHPYHMIKSAQFFLRVCSLCYVLFTTSLFVTPFIQRTPTNVSMPYTVRGEQYPVLFVLVLS